LTALGLLALARPVNCAIAALATVAGYLLAQGHDPLAATLAALATATIAAAGNALNDAQDAELDRAAHPRRPIPAGRATPAEARGFAGALVAVGLAAAAGAAGFALAGFAAGTVALLLLYEWRLKRWGLAGNVAVAALTAATLLFGAAAAGAWPRIVGVAAAMAFLANLAREVAKDAEDMAADAGHRRTFPMQVGPRAAGATACGLALAAAAVPLAAGLLDWAVLAAAAVVLAGGALAVARPGLGQRVLRVGMALAVAGFLALGVWNPS
jgi:geranylgeranylglycerol-phosphate geranylgeranyltransferase